MIREILVEAGYEVVSVQDFAHNRYEVTLLCDNQPVFETTQCTLARGMVEALKWHNSRWSVEEVR